jgi:hypothetical protein
VYIAVTPIFKVYISLKRYHRFLVRVNFASQLESTRFADYEGVNSFALIKNYKMANLDILIVIWFFLSIGNPTSSIIGNVSVDLTPVPGPVLISLSLRLILRIGSLVGFFI